MTTHRATHAHPRPSTGDLVGAAITILVALLLAVACFIAAAMN